MVLPNMPRKCSGVFDDIPKGDQTVLIFDYGNRFPQQVSPASNKPKALAKTVWNGSPADLAKGQTR